MKTFLIHLWDTLRSSYWFIPLLAVFTALAAGTFFPLWEFGLQSSDLPQWLKATTGSARATLSTISGAMIAVVGTVFSINVVTLSLTSQQFGPRLLRTFMHDSVTQFTVSLFLATTVYATLVLRVIEKHPQAYEPPHISIALGVLAFIKCMILLVYFIHHIAVLIQAPRIVESVGEDLNIAIDRLYPDTSTDSMQKLSEIDISNLRFTTPVPSGSEGYIQAFDRERIITLADEYDFVVKFNFRPGDFVSDDDCLALIDLPTIPKPLTAKLQKCIIVGRRRTPRQDLECAINELVEVAVRSLSPGINDPFTAMTCIDRLGGALAKLAARDFPSAQHLGRDDKLRLITKGTSFDGIIAASFNQLRQYAGNAVAVHIRALEALQRIASSTATETAKQTIKKHAQMILSEAKRHIKEESDLRDVVSAFEKTQQASN